MYVCVTVFFFPLSQMLLIKLLLETQHIYSESFISPSFFFKTETQKTSIDMSNVHLNNHFIQLVLIGYFLLFYTYS